MIRPVISALALTLCATGAWADRYDDCVQDKDPDLTIRGCTSVIERGKQESREWRAKAYNNRGAAYYKKGELDRAIANFDKAIALNPKFADAYNNRGVAYFGQGDKEKAIADFRNALEIDPSHPGAKQNLKALDSAAIAPSPGATQPTDDLAALIQRLGQLHDQGKFVAEIPVARRALELAEKLYGPEHANVGTLLNRLAWLYKSQGSYDDAEPLYQRALTIAEKALGPQHLDVGDALNNLALLYYFQGRYSEAEPLYQRALAIAEKALGPDHPHVGASLNNLAALYKAQGRYGEAEALYQRALAIGEKAQGSDNPSVATSLNNLAALYESQGHYEEAEPLYQRSLAILEKALGPDHANVATSINNLAALYDTLGRYDDAERLYQRGLTIREKVLGPDHPDVATSLNNLAELYRAQGRYPDAEALYKRSLAIKEKALGPDHPAVATALNNLAALYKAQGRYGEAEALLDRALIVGAIALGPEDLLVAKMKNNLAEIYKAQGRYSEAESRYISAFGTIEAAFGLEHPLVADMFNNLASLHFAQGDWAGAANFWRRSTKIIAGRTERGGSTLGHAPRATGKSEAERLSERFWNFVKAAHRLTAEGHAPTFELAAETFLAAQWGQSSEAADSLRRMAARGATGNTDLAALVRERQDLVGEWRFKDKQLIAAKSQEADKRDASAEKALGDRLSAIDARIGEIDQRLEKEFPDYAALVSLKPLSMPGVQSLLRDGEALVLVLDTPEWGPYPEATFIWAVTKTDSRWVKSDLGTKALGERVAALRCGLDYDGSWGAPGSTCGELLKTTYSQADHESGKPLPFDIKRSHELYKALFGQIEDLIKDKQLLIVPSGALTQLPFQVLVTEKPDQGLSGSDALRNAAWLNRSHALTVLPSVSSLRALRQLAKDSHASKPFIGFGDPLLDGRPDRYPDDAAIALRARANQSCPKELSQQVASLRGLQRGVRPLALRGGMADVAEIRSQVPLPETANELCAVARDLGVSGDDIRLGAHATETKIKQLSQAGELAKYRIVHFATHGALAGQVGGDSEPGLLLTPPEKATETDDGYLSASEVAALKLDADWVILSACNTAAGGTVGAEALSGLARAFFYAGARALLVSHWSVYSDATVKLITGAIGRMAADKSVGRAEALRLSMLALIDKGAPYETQPAYWAPFVVVGEGGAQAVH